MATVRERTAATQANSYWFTYIGNVLGAPGDMTGWTYQGDLTSGPDIWAPGWGESDAEGIWHTDPKVISSTFSGRLLREGNWDWLTSSQKWDSGVTPVAIPNSLYLTSAPAFFGSKLWPWVQPAPRIYGGPCHHVGTRGRTFHSPILLSAASKVNFKSQIGTVYFVVQFRIVRSFDRPCIYQDFRPFGSLDRNLKTFVPGARRPLKLPDLGRFCDDP